MKKIIVANWKMNPQSLLKAEKLFLSIKNGIEKTHNILKKTEIIICPPFVYLEPLSKLLKPKTYNLQLKLGAQDLFWEEKGAFTGEISPKMLKNLRIEYVILGHSERRHILKETDEMIAKKLKTAIKNKLKPILCIGETERERNLAKPSKS
jgi:triosephosphate isomerase (TIM)